MRNCKNNSNADDLRKYFDYLYEWHKNLFPHLDNNKKGVNWGYLYKRYKGRNSFFKNTSKTQKDLMNECKRPKSELEIRKKIRNLRVYSFW